MSDRAPARNKRCHAQSSVAADVWDSDVTKPPSAIKRLVKLRNRDFARPESGGAERRNPNGTRDTAKAHLQHTLNSFEGKIDRAVRRWQLRLPEERTWAAIHGHGRKQEPLGSNQRIRYQLGAAFIDMMAGMFEQQPARRFFIISVLHDGWRAAELRTHIDLLDIQRRGYQVLRLIGLPAIAVIEFQATVNWRRGIGRNILPHVHAIAWTDDLRYNADQAAKRLNEGRRLRSAHGEPPVTVVEIDHTLGDVAHAAGYLFKAPFEGKDIVPPSKRHAKGYTYSRTESVRPALMLRLDEVLSQVEFNELIMTHGCAEQGRRVRSVLAATGRSVVSAPRNLTATRFWRAARAKNGRDQYDPITFTRR